MKVSKRHHCLLMFVATLLLLTSCQKEGTEVWQSTTKGAYTVTMTVDRDKKEVVCSVDYLNPPHEVVFIDSYKYYYQVLNDSILHIYIKYSPTGDLYHKYVYRKLSKDCVFLEHQGGENTSATFHYSFVFTKIE